MHLVRLVAVDCRLLCPMLALSDVNLALIKASQNRASVCRAWLDPLRTTLGMWVVLSLALLSRLIEISRQLTCDFCTRGHFCNTTRMTAPNLCLIGGFCPNDGMVEPFPCLPGYSCLREGLVQPVPCDPGFFRRGSYWKPSPCPAGYYCPGMASQPQPCMWLFQSEPLSAVPGSFFSGPRRTVVRSFCLSASLARQVLDFLLLSSLAD